MPYADPEKQRLYDWFRSRAETPRRPNRGGTKPPLRPKAKVSAYNRKQKYGLTQAAFVALVDSQGGVCPGCLERLDITSRYAHVDHCHRTHRIRGVLCHSCNHALPVKMTPETLRRLATYLEATQEGQVP